MNDAPPVALPVGPAAHRVGQPSPLIFHLGAALTAYGQALLAAPRADAPNFPWSGDLGGAAAKLGPDLDQVEIAAEVAARLRRGIEGLEIWQAHPYRRNLEDPPEIWRAGCSRLLDYGAVPGARDPSGPPVLVVPSLINRAYILDLAPGRSMLRWLAGQGLRPLLLDWGAPGPEEIGFDLHDYGEKRLLPALDHARAATGGRVALMGYCMGGTLSVGLAARRPEGIAGLVTIGAPWDFRSTLGVAGGFRAMLRSQGTGKIEGLIDSLGQVFGFAPVSLFQMLFALINPMQASVKFQKLAALDPASAEATHFVALEDWLADGIAMPVGAARDLLVDWQIRNLTASGQWRFLGGAVTPRAIEAPALIFCGRADSIAPPPLSEPLARLIPGARVARPATGHVGMVVGRGAPGQVWRPAAEFLLKQASRGSG